MKKIIFYSLLVISSSLLAQSKSDLGFVVGTAYYMGDINPTIPFYPPGLNIGATYRYNLNARYVIKGEINYLTISANDASSSDTYQKLRNSSFNSKFYDFAAQFEFNFLPLKFVERKVYFSPFVSAGFGAAEMLSSAYVKSIIPIFPAALGVRTTLGKKWSVGWQWNMRKTFTDKIDGVSNLISPSMQTRLNNNDWYFFSGLFLTYKVFDFPGECPAYVKEF